MLTLFAMAVVTAAATLLAYALGRSYPRVHAVEAHEPLAWVLERPIGIASGAVVMTIGRHVTPGVGYETGHGLLATVAVSAGSSVILITLVDIVFSDFVAEPSYAESREAYLQYGGHDSNGDDWIDITTRDADERS